MNKSVDAFTNTQWCKGAVAYHYNMNIYVDVFVDTVRHYKNIFKTIYTSQ